MKNINPLDPLMAQTMVKTRKDVACVIFTSHGREPIVLAEYQIEKQAQKQSPKEKIS